MESLESPGNREPNRVVSLDLTVIADAEPAASASDFATYEAESKRHDLDRAWLHNEKLRSEIADQDQDRLERERYAKKIFELLVSWLVLVGIALFVNGSKPNGFDISDQVMLMLLGTSTTGVIGIFLIVANYLFPKPPRAKE